MLIGSSTRPVARLHAAGGAFNYVLSADAALIVRAVNSHTALVAALMALLGPERDLTDAPCHVGICGIGNCARCSRELTARATLRLAKGEG